MKKRLQLTLCVICILVTQLLILGRQVSQADPKNEMCLTEQEFTDFNAMDLPAIRNWLDSLGGFLKGTVDGKNYTFTDLDGKPTDPAEQIYSAAQTYKINPRVLLTTLRKEKPIVFRNATRPDDNELALLAGCGKPSSAARNQIQCMGQVLKQYYYDELSQCKATIGKWQVDTVLLAGDTAGEETDTFGETCPVKPESKAVAALYQYTPWAGAQVGCGQAPAVVLPGKEPPGLVGGNGLFCAFWKQHKWQTPPGPLSVSQPNPMLTCGGPTAPRCVSLNVSGGTPPYTWSVSKGPLAYKKGGPMLTVTGAKNVQVKPPQGKSDQQIGGPAYDLRASTQYNSGASVCSTFHCSEAFTCSDNFFNSTAGNGCAECHGVPTKIQSGDCSGTGLCAGCGVNICVFSNVNPQLTCNARVSPNCVQDRRLDWMKEQGCLPCMPEMQGATISVSDGSGGPPVSVPLTVNY